MPSIKIAEKLPKKLTIFIRKIAANIFQNVAQSGHTDTIVEVNSLVKLNTFLINFGLSLDKR